MNAPVMDLSNGFVRAVERAGRSTVSINEGGRAGVSGTIWRDGLVVAAEHTIPDESELTVELPAGNSSFATVIGRDPTTDIGLLRLKEPSPANTEFAEISQLRVGQFVLAIGRRGKQGLVASHGIISALSGSWRTWRGGRIDHSFRVDLVPFTGFSGGPLLDLQGKVIGVNTSGPRRSVMTVPIDTVNRVVDQLLAKGRVPRGFLGIAVQSVKLHNLPESPGGGPARGLVVVMVEPGGPAEKTGLTIGDIILTVDDKPLIETTDLQAALDSEKVGTTLKLRVLRGGKSHEMAVTVAERSE